MEIRKVVAAAIVFAGMAFAVDAQASVAVSWPSGVPNTCKSPTDGFIDFEYGQDGLVVRSTIPAAQFTTTDGQDWLYGDWRSGGYNGPYPNGGFTSNGNLFTWLGPSQAQGRIDFLAGPASYVSVLTSTSSGLVLDAFDENGEFIATSGYAAANVDTGTLSRLTVESPSGKSISYVLIHDSGNRWLIDDLCTDAEGIPPAYTAVAQTVQTVIGADYTFGAKGYDGGTNGSHAFVPPQNILLTGYNYYEGYAAKSWTPGIGLDCSGLSMWAYNRTFFGETTVNWNDCINKKSCPIFQEGAQGQYDGNTERILATDTRVGDLLFFDECIGSAASCKRGQDQAMDHVAMFVDSFQYGGKTYNAVHASGFAGATVPATFDVSSQTLTTHLPDGRIQKLQVAGYGRVSDPRLDAWIVTKSPVHLVVTDPDSVQVTHENALLNDQGHTREVPGMYYMVKEIVAGAADDTVAIPRLKNGIYFIDLEPKPNAHPSDVFSLEIRLPDATIVLADQVSLQGKRSYAFEVSPQAFQEGVRFDVDIKPGDETACINPKSKGNTPIAILGNEFADVRSISMHTLELDGDSDRGTPGVSPIRWAMDSDVNSDGIPDMILHFSTRELEAEGLLENNRRTFLTGQYIDGRPIAGTAVVHTIGSSDCR